jgi:excisionase family DNA binding protein
VGGLSCSEVPRRFLLADEQAQLAHRLRCRVLLIAGFVGGAVSDERLLTAGEVAELLSVRRRWVEDATRRGELPHVKLGRFARYRRETILAWVAEREQGGPVGFARRPVPRTGTG